MANIRLPKYDARISGKTIRMRVCCLSLPEPKSIRCEIAVDMAFFPAVRARRHRKVLCSAEPTDILSDQMPIFEYECGRCGALSSQVVLGSEKESRPSCPQCGSSRTHRVLSSFAMTVSEDARLADFDTSKPRDESFYRDSRNVGLWAKKRAKQMGVDLGSKFEATVEKARSGKLIKDME